MSTESPKQSAFQLSRPRRGTTSLSPTKAGPSRLAHRVDLEDDDDDIEEVDVPPVGPGRKKGDAEPIPAQSNPSSAGRARLQVAIQIQRPSNFRRQDRVQSPAAEEQTPEEPSADEADGAGGDPPAEPDVEPVTDDPISIRPAPTAPAHPPPPRVTDRRSRVNLSSSAATAAASWLDRANPTAMSKPSGLLSKNPTAVSAAHDRMDRMPAMPPPSSLLLSSPSLVHTQSQNETIEEFSSPERTPARKKRKGVSTDRPSRLAGKEPAESRPSVPELALVPSASAETTAVESDTEEVTDRRPRIVKRIIDGEEAWVDADEYDAETLATQATQVHRPAAEEPVHSALPVVAEADQEQASALQDEDEELDAHQGDVVPADASEEAANDETDTAEATPERAANPRLSLSPDSPGHSDTDRLTEQTRTLFRDLQAEREQTAALREKLSKLEARPMPEPVVIERFVERIDNGLADEVAQVRKQLAEAEARPLPEPVLVERVVERVDNSMAEELAQVRKQLEEAAAQPVPEPVVVERIVERVDDTLAAELAQIRKQLGSKTKSLKKAQEDNEFLRDLYTNASDSAVAEAARVRELEENVKKLQEKLSVGLKQRHSHFQAIAATRTAESERFRMQNKLLLDQARLTDDAVRARAVKYPQVLRENEQLRDKLAEAEDAVSRLKSRNEELVDQVEYQRAKQMGVFPDDQSAKADDATDTDTNSDDSYRPSPDLAARGYTVRERSGRTTLAASSELYITASPGPSATVDSPRQAKIGRSGLARTEDVFSQGASQDLFEGGEHYECQWMMDGNKPCPVSTDTTEVGSLDAT